MDLYKQCVDEELARFLNATHSSIEAYEQGSKRATEMLKLNTTEIPKELLSELDQYHAASHQLRLALIALNAYITLRIPEIKDEDNTGVNVQVTVKRTISGFLYKNNKEGNEDIEASKFKFLEERAKIAGKPLEEKEKAVQPPQEEKELQLKELNVMTARGLVLAWKNLEYIHATVAYLVATNRSKIDTPRNDHSALRLT